MICEYCHGKFFPCVALDDCAYTKSALPPVSLYSYSPFCCSPHGRGVCSASLSFHQKACIEKQKYVDVPCPYCDQVMQQRDLKGHIKKCSHPSAEAARAARKERRKSGSGTAAGAGAAGSDGTVAEEVLTGMPGADGRVPCPVCNRRFAVDRLAPHQRVCRKVTASAARRGKWDSKKARQLKDDKGDGGTSFHASTGKGKRAHADRGLRDAIAAGRRARGPGGPDVVVAAPGGGPYVDAGGSPAAGATAAARGGGGGAAPARRRSKPSGGPAVEVMSPERPAGHGRPGAGGGRAKPRAAAGGAHGSAEGHVLDEHNTFGGGHERFADGRITVGLNSHGMAAPEPRHAVRHTNATSLDNPLATSEYQVMDHEGALPASESFVAQAKRAYTPGKISHSLEASPDNPMVHPAYHGRALLHDALHGGGHATTGGAHAGHTRRAGGGPGIEVLAPDGGHEHPSPAGPGPRVATHSAGEGVRVPGTGAAGVSGGDRPRGRAPAPNAFGSSTSGGLAAGEHLPEVTGSGKIAHPIGAEGRASTGGDYGRTYMR